MEIKKSLEWISGKTKITIKQSGNNIHIEVYPDYPNDESVELKAKFGRGWFIFDDLMGNGSGSERQARGWGKLIVNTAIQVLANAHEERYGAISPKEIIVKGSTSNVDDPKTEPEKTECRDRRNGFWGSFGLNIKDKESFHSDMETTLSSLRYNKNGKTENNGATYIDLSQFWGVDDRPQLIESDLRYLKEIDLEQLNENSIPAKDREDELERKAQFHFRLTEKSTFIAGVVIIVVIASLIEISFNTIMTASFGIFIWRYVSLSFISRISYNFPSSKKAREYSVARNAKIREMKNAIIDIEDNINGLIWRVHAYLSHHFEGFDLEEHDELYSLSKKNSHLISDYRAEYSKYINRARKFLKD